jgi:hypothetical protein
MAQGGAEAAINGRQRNSASLLGQYLHEHLDELIGQAQVTLAEWKLPNEVSFSCLQIGHDTRSYDVLGVGFGTQRYAPALGPELLRDRNSYKNNTARTPAFHTWAVQWKSSPSFKGSSLIPAEPGRATCPKRRSSNANGLCGQKSARSAEILRDFQRDILSRHFRVRVSHGQPRSRSLSVRSLLADARAWKILG